MLQKALEALATRHAATTSTLHTQLASAQCARLRDMLDEATEQLARETYSRRREIALRLAVVGREDQLAEALRRWVRRAQETCAREDVLGSCCGRRQEMTRGGIVEHRYAFLRFVFRFLTKIIGRGRYSSARSVGVPSSTAPASAPSNSMIRRSWRMAHPNQALVPH